MQSKVPIQLIGIVANTQRTKRNADNRNNEFYSKLMRQLRDNHKIISTIEKTCNSIAMIEGT